MGCRKIAQSDVTSQGAGLHVSTSGVLAAISLLGLLLLGVGCGTQSSNRPTGTASLALQSKAPVWGGDPQPAVTDVVRVAITHRQAKVIARACSDAPSELPSSGAGTCEDEIQRVIRLATHLPCIHRLCLVVARTAPGQAAQPDGFVQIDDEQPGAPLCHSGPGHLCFRLGTQAPVLQVLASTSPVTPSPSPTLEPTVTTSPTPTGSSPTPTDTTSSTTPNPTEPETSPSAESAS